MNEKKNSNLPAPRPEGGVVRNAINQLKLIFRLLGDRRVNVLAKVIPIGAFAYLFFPADLVPNIALPVIGVLDDAAILWLGSYVFVELCPPEVVAEHMKALAGNTTVQAGDEVVDAETTDISDKQP